jgi:hypothetical protein
LSTVLVAMFFSGSIKSVDWMTTYVLVFDINFVLFVAWIYYLYRFVKLFKILPFNRKADKLDLVFSAKKLLNNFILKIFFKK